MELLTIDQAAEYLTCSVSLVRKLVHQKRVAVVRVGSLIRFSREDLDAYLTARRSPAVTAEPLPSWRPLRAAR